MTPEEFANEMKELSNAEDLETMHSKMDELMCSILCALGYGDGVEVFIATDKWYA